MSPPSEGRPGSPARLALAFGIAAFVLDLMLVPRAPGIGDAAEFTLALALGGAPHPTGYPLYVLAGFPFVHLLHALGLDWVRAAGAWSALGAAAAAGLFAGLVAQLTEHLDPARRFSLWLARLAPVLVLALHPVWLRAATEPEVYSWWFAWIAGAAWFCFAAVVALEPGALKPPRPTRIAALWGVICGAGLAHHALSMIFAIPLTLALFAALRQRAVWRSTLLIAAGIGAVIPLASWGFLVWRAFHPASYQWPLEPSLGAVWAHIRGAAYAGYLGGFAPRPAERALLAGTLLPIVIPGLVLSAFAALREARPALRAARLALVLSASLLLAFTLNYGVPDPAMYCVPVLMVALLWMSSVPPLLTSRLPRTIIAMAAIAAIVSTAVWGLSATLSHRAQLVRIDTRIRAAWNAIPFERGVVLWKDDHCARLVLFQLLERSHSERVVANPTRLTWRTERLAFERRTGFDALAGLDLHTKADLALIPPNVRRLSPLPVVEFKDVLGVERSTP